MDTHWNVSNMIYGDNPQKINEREDALGLKTYTYVPQITAIVQAGNLYVYCAENPLRFVDRNGQWTLALGGEIAGAFGLRLSKGWQIIIDGEGNIGLLSYSGIGFGTPTISGAAVLTWTNASSILDLDGRGGAAGWSVYAFGFESNMGGNGLNSPIGFTGSVGFSNTPFEAHAEITKTKVIIIGDWRNSYLFLIFERIVGLLYAQMPSAEQESVIQITGRSW